MQTCLFHESMNDAICDVVRVLGGKKKVGLMLRPEKDAEEASRWLSDCLNPERPAKLDPDQVLFLMREGRKVGCHSAINFICAEAGYSPAQPVEPQDEIAELQRSYIEATKQLMAMAARIEKVSSK